MAADESNDDRIQSFVALTKGTAVSHYKIVEKIGSGGMGEVYLALDTKLNRKVALKFLPPHLYQDEDCPARFKREAQVAAGTMMLRLPAISSISMCQLTSPSSPNSSLSSTGTPSWRNDHPRFQALLAKYGAQ